MKILFIVNKFPVLSESFILNQMTGLIARGHEVEVFAPVKGDMAVVHPDVIKYGLMERAIFPPAARYKITKALQLLASVARYSLSDARVVSRFFRAFKHCRRAGKLWLLHNGMALLGRRYDIIHCHFGPNGVAGLELKDVGLIDGLLVTTFHGYDITTFLQKQPPGVYAALFQRGDLFLPISRRWQQRLEELGCNPAKISVHRMGIDCERFTFKPIRPSHDGPIRLLTIARLVEKKGVAYAIQAVSSLTAAGHDVCLSVVGDGPLRQDLEQLCLELKSGASVQLLGWKNQDQIAVLLGQADLLLTPSVTAANGDQEGIPVALMEAMAMGLPVISTFHSGIPELVQDGVSGALVAERDSVALAAKIAWLIEHPDLCTKMSVAARREVEARFDINWLNDRLVELFATRREIEPPGKQLPTRLSVAE